MDAPNPGDVIYVDTDLHVWHGADDFRGGKAIVRAVRMGNRGSPETASVEVAQNPGTWYTWAPLAERQGELFSDAVS